MSSGIFNPQNRFWQTLDHFADLLILSLLWLVCSLPLVTAGAACAALYDAVARCVRGAEPLPWKRFWQTFRRELPCAAAVTVAWGALLWLLAWALRLIGAAAAAGSAAAPLVLVFCLVLMSCRWGPPAGLFPLLSRFTFRPVGLMLTALRLAVGCLPRTVGLVAILVASAALVWVLLFPVVILPGGWRPGCLPRCWSRCSAATSPKAPARRSRRTTANKAKKDRTRCTAGTVFSVCTQRKRPVTLSGQARIASGAPQATRRPPSAPPPGPISRM